MVIAEAESEKHVIEIRKRHNNNIQFLQRMRGLITSSLTLPVQAQTSPNEETATIRRRRRLEPVVNMLRSIGILGEAEEEKDRFETINVRDCASRSPIESYVDLDEEEMPIYSSLYSDRLRPTSSKSTRSKNCSETLVRNIPVTIIRDDHSDDRTVCTPTHTTTVTASKINDQDEEEPILIEEERDGDGDTDQRTVIISSISNPNSERSPCSTSYSSLTRRSLHEENNDMKQLMSVTNLQVHSKSDADEVIIMDEAVVVPEKEKKFPRSNKDTLVGGANKVFENISSNGHTASNPVDALGAGFLTSSPPPYEMLLQSDHDIVEKPVNDVPNYPIYLSLKTKLIQECRLIDHIRGDGNCFFRALSKQLYESEKYHLVVRNLLVDLIATNKSQFAQFVDGGDVQDHVERMSQEGCWATTCEIYAAATLLHRDIFMLTPDHLNQSYSWLLFKPVFEINPDECNIESHPCYITLCNTNGNHYDRIVGEHGSCNCFMPHPELDGITYSVDLTENL